MLTATAKPTGSSVPPLEAGTYVARCVQLVDLGDQMNELAGRLQRQVMILWEIPSERLEINGEDKPRVMSKTYTLSLSDRAKLRADLETWRGLPFSDEELKGFDLRNILNKGCMLTVVTKASKTTGKPYNTIGGVSKLIRGLEVPAAETPIFAFDLDDKDSLEAIEALPNWIRERIEQSETYKNLVADRDNASMSDVSEDDIPDF